MSSGPVDRRAGTERVPGWLIVAVASFGVLLTVGTIFGPERQRGNAVTAAASPAAHTAAPRTTLPPNAYIVATVLDGATIEVVDHGGNRATVGVRGLDAPSPQQSDCFGTESFAWAARTLLGQTVTLRTGVGRPAKVGTTAAELSLPDGTDYARAALTGGYATYTDAPAPRGDEYRAAEDAARAAGAGLWGACDRTLDPPATSAR